MIFARPKRRVSKVFLHCSASDLDAHDDISVIKRWHVMERGFSDVGYHFFITRNGAIQFGRSLEVAPAAQQWHNTGTIAICVHGNSRFTESQMKSLKKLCREIHASYQGNVTFHGHCEVDKGKTCPVFDYRVVLGLDADGRIQPATS